MSKLPPINISDIQDKLYKKIIGTGWDEHLRLFIRSGEFSKIIKQLYNDVDNGYHFTPTLNDVLKPFQLCQYKDLKVVFLIAEPYLFINIADGLAFSQKTAHTKFIQEYIREELARTIYNERDFSWNHDLSHWAKQGILLLNCTLTTRLDKYGKHVEIWRPFMNHMFDVFNTDDRKIIYVFFGETYQMWGENLSEDKTTFFVSDPGKLGSYYKGNKWDSFQLFKRINEYLKDANSLEIIW